MFNWIKKLLVLFGMAIILLPASSFAYNPCNEIPYPYPPWLYTFPDVSEFWNGHMTNKMEGPLCPPWNKTARSGCLKQFRLPHQFEIVYNKF